MEKNPEDLRVAADGDSFLTGVLQNLPSCSRSLLAKFLCLNRLSQIRKQISTIDQEKNIFDRILELLGVTFEISQMDYARIPRMGTALVIANHPFGGVEGLILGSLLCSARSEAKIMANYLLNLLNVPELSDRFIYVDPFGGKQSIRSNIKPVREAIKWVREGGLLGIFPAGEVSHFHLKRREITDPSWSITVARIIKKSGASVLPIFFAGSNSLMFQMFGVLHPKLRTVMLPREMLNKKHCNIQVKIGKSIPYEKLLRLHDDRNIMEYLRVKTYMLGSHKDKEESQRQIKAGRRRMVYAPVVTPQAPHLLAKEVNALPAQQMLIDSGKFSVFVAESRQIPHLLQEIGRLREITFRQAGEGTGRATDLDCFDRYYLHLFLWNRETGEVAGGYRLGLTDTIAGKYGMKGLYTSTLFAYRSEFLDHIGPAIELGRSFVCPDYQKTFQPLMLLWRGIGRFVSARPQYRMLFGPVSVSNDYHSISRQLIAAYSKKKCHQTDVARFVKGNNTHISSYKIKSDRNIKAASDLLQDIQELSELISDIERDQRGIPILLKHYLKLGGEFLAFSTDPKFSGVMDVLILVDLTRTNANMLERYMGKSGAESFLNYHRIRTLADCA